VRTRCDGSIYRSSRRSWRKRGRRPKSLQLGPQKHVDQTIGNLLREAKQLRARLEEVEAALSKWKQFSTSFENQFKAAPAGLVEWKSSRPMLPNWRLSPHRLFGPYQRLFLAPNHGPLAVSSESIRCSNALSLAVRRAQTRPLGARPVRSALPLAGGCPWGSWPRRGHGRSSRTSTALRRCRRRAIASARGRTLGTRTPRSGSAGAPRRAARPHWRPPAAGQRGPSSLSQWSDAPFPSGSVASGQPPHQGAQHRGQSGVEGSRDRGSRRAVPLRRLPAVGTRACLN
jgi:hypothetical protein